MRCGKGQNNKIFVIGSVTVTKLRYFGHNCLTRNFISKQEDGKTKQSQHDQTTLCLQSGKK